MKKIILITVASFMIQPSLADWTDAFDNPKPMYAKDLYNNSIGNTNSYGNTKENTESFEMDYPSGGLSFYYPNLAYSNKNSIGGVDYLDANYNNGW